MYISIMQEKTQEKSSTSVVTRFGELFLPIIMLTYSIGMGILVFWPSNEPEQSNVQSISDENYKPAPGSNTPYTPSKTPRIPGKGEFINIGAVPDSIGNIYFVGLFKNTGEIAIRKPRVDLSLLDEAGNEVATAFGYGSFDYLNPGEECPLQVLVSKAPAYKKIKIKTKPEPRYNFDTKVRPKITIKAGKVTKRQYSGYELSGQLTNEDTESAVFVSTIALLLTKDGKTAGMGYTYIKEKELGAGQTANFTINFYSMNGTPEKYKLYVNAQKK
ncbi:MAG: hypothetical protein KDK45_15865 [Leptospiraceae bacterium]|nr:hypothetical protein [Leptospiraceae bacterium]